MTWRPIVVFILNFFVGALVANGIVPASHQDEVVRILSDIVGYLIILFTSIAALIHALKNTGSNPIKNETTDDSYKQLPVGGGTPQSDTTEQNMTSNTQIKFPK